MTIFGKTSIFGTVKQAITRGLATAAFLGASFAATAGDTYVINQYGEVTLSEYSATELATTGMVQMVVTTVDAYGEASDSFVVTQARGNEVGPGQGDVDPDGYTGNDEVDSYTDTGEGGPGQGDVDPDGKRALSNDSITITIPRSTKGPVVLIVDGKVMVVPTN